MNQSKEKICKKNITFTVTFGLPGDMRHLAFPAASWRAPILSLVVVMPLGQGTPKAMQVGKLHLYFEPG
jgi:hypothetical protein